MEDAGARVASATNIKQIVFALRQYAEAHDGRLPPASLCDKSGKPLLSWRVVILPYVEHENLYNRFRLDEPWDSPQNLALLSEMPRVYASPPNLPATARVQPFCTFYQVFTGKGTAFDGSEGLRIPDDFPDGTANTLLVTEAGEAAPWTKPADLAYEADRPLPPLGGVFTGESRFSLFGSRRRKGIMMALADGSIHFEPPKASTETDLRNAIIRNDGKIPGPDW